MVCNRKMKNLLADPRLGSNSALEPLDKVIADAEVVLDTDALLAGSMARAANVLVPSVFTTGMPQGRPDKPFPPCALKSAVDEPNGFSMPALRGQQPIEIIGAAVAGVGHLNQLPDVDGAIRQEPLLVNYFGKAVPSMSLLAVAKSLNLEPTDIKLNVGESVQIGKLVIRTEESALVQPQFYKGRDGKPAFAADSFYGVMLGKIFASKYTDKIVIIGSTAVGAGAFFNTPAGPGLPAAKMLAHITPSILSERFIVQPAWGIWATLSILLVVIGYLVASLPRLSAGKAAYGHGGTFNGAAGSRVCLAGKRRQVATTGVSCSVADHLPSCADHQTISDDRSRQAEIR